MLKLRAAIDRNLGMIEGAVLSNGSSETHIYVSDAIQTIDEVLDSMEAAYNELADKCRKHENQIRRMVIDQAACGDCDWRGV